MDNSTVKLAWYDPLKVWWSVSWRAFLYSCVFSLIAVSISIAGQSLEIVQIYSWPTIAFVGICSIIGTYLFFYLPYKQLNGIDYKTFKIAFPEPNTVGRRLKLILVYCGSSFLASFLISIVFEVLPFIVYPALVESMPPLRFTIKGVGFIVSFCGNYYILRRWMTKGIFGQHLILIPRNVVSEPDAAPE